MTDQLIGPDGLPCLEAVLLPPHLFPINHVLSWWAREIKTIITKPKWWQFWLKPTTSTKSQWIRHSYVISSDFSEYILADNLRAVSLIYSLHGPTTIWGLALDSSSFDTNYIQCSIIEGESND
jgi:hypothetical protein